MTSTDMEKLKKKTILNDKFDLEQKQILIDDHHHKIIVRDKLFNNRRRNLGGLFLISRTNRTAIINVTMHLIQYELLNGRLSNFVMRNIALDTHKIQKKNENANTQKKNMVN